MRFNDMEEGKIPGGNFTFTNIRTEHLGATEYTLVTLAFDVSGSVSPFKQELKASLTAALASCQKSPRSENLLVRVIIFSSSLAGGVQELHGFKPLADIDINSYQDFCPSGGTPLVDASYSAVGATNAYAQQLYKDDYLVNVIIIVTTDGGDNASAMKASAIKREIEKAIQGEFIESVITILVGVNVTSCSGMLQLFQTEAGFTQYIDAGDATPAKLAKLADFVSQSISSQSQSLGTGGPSQNISTTI